MNPHQYQVLQQFVDVMRQYDNTPVLPSGSYRYYSADDMDRTLANIAGVPRLNSVDDYEKLKQKMDERAREMFNPPPI
jgi:hypothetical protein